MPLMIVTEAFSKQPVAIDPEMIGEVRSLEGKNRMGKTRITSKRSRRGLARGPASRSPSRRRQ